METTTPVALRAERMWDPLTGLLERPVLVRIRDGLIRDIGAAGAAVHAGGVLEMGPDVTLLPGLVDCHAHLCWDPGANHVADFARADEAVLEQRVLGACRQLLAAGITTVRDLGDRGYVTLRCREAMARPWLGPALLAAGPPITPAGGHCWFLGGQTQAPDVEAAVMARADRGVDVVTIMATGGKITPGSAPHESQYDAATLSRAVEAATSRSLPVTAHAHGPDGIADAVAAGVTGIEHCTFLTADAVAVDWSLVERIAARGIHLSAPEASWHTGDGLGLPPDPRLPEVWNNLVRMHRAGVQLSISSDSGISPRKPHGILAQGAERLVRHGLTTHDALVAITATPAAACGLAHRKGRLAPGYDADVLAVHGDPTSDITALRRPAAVVRQGRLVRSAGSRAQAPTAQEVTP